jgi:DNA-binding winged helix-turn-helix (wHTH) protein/TolB-like protein/Tfp pilus assembly protein PilF
MLTGSVRELYEFDAFRVDAGRHLLLRDGETVNLAPRAFNMLLTLIRRRGEVLAKDELMRQLWPDTVVEENNLTVIISALRKALGENPQQHRYIVTIPGRGYSFVADVKGVGESWPEAGLPVADALLPVEPGRDARFSSRQIAWVTLAVLLSGLAVAVAVWFFNRSRPPVAELPVKTIAVLPFKNLSGQSGDEYLTLGLPDTLITSLGNLRQVVTRPTSSVLKHADADPLAAGRQLGVDAVIDGRFQRLNNRLRVTVQLIRVSDGVPLWSEKFDETFTDVFAVQDATTEHVSQALALRLSGEEKKLLARTPTVNAEAYQLYLRGRYFWNKRTADGLKKGIQYFTQATEKDPGYAQAWAGLADCYSLLSYYSLASPQEAFPKAKAAAQQALTIDDSLAEAHTSLALALMAYDRDGAAAEREYQRALALNSNYPTAHQWYAEYLTAQGRFDEALAEIKRARELDPLSLITNSIEGFVYYYARRYNQSAAQLQKLLELDADFWPARWFLGWTLSAQGHHQQALAELERTRQLSGNNTGVIAELGRAYAVAGRKEEARRTLQELLARVKTGYVTPYSIAAIYVGLGEHDEALTWLRKAETERAWEYLYLKVDPKFDALRAHPRYAVARAAQ